jgi:DNA-binding transcriptional LysR family regulator
MDDLRAAAAFSAVAAQKSFTAAARMLGVTASALSQSVRGLEDRLGVPLLVRTTRSVALTEAGRRLFERIGPALRETQAAVDEARGSADVVQGTLRISLGRLTVQMLEPLVAALLERYPRLSVELDVDDSFVDIVARGFDAGIRLSESIDADLTHVRLTPPFRLVIAGSPKYFATHGRPKKPSDLLEHQCIGYRMLSTGALYAWELEKNGREQRINVRGRFMCNDGHAMLIGARRGLGLTYIHEPAITADLESGRLEVVLEDWAPTVPGFFLYYPSRSSLQPKLRALIDLARDFLPTVHPDPRTGSTGRGQHASSNEASRRGRRGVRRRV